MNAPRLPGTWLGTEKPAMADHLNKAVIAVLSRIADESADTSARIYTQAEVVRAVEIVSAELLIPLQALVALEPDNSGDFEGEPEKYAAARDAIAKWTAPA